MFRGPAAFNQNIGGWNVARASGMHKQRREQRMSFAIANGTAIPTAHRGWLAFQYIQAANIHQ
jgi:hypothetical protein